MTTTEKTSSEPFMVVGLSGTTRLEITVGSAAAAAAAAWYWQGSGLPAEWYLRGDVIHERPVLLFTQADDGTVHATPLVPGRPVSSHLLTSCGAQLEPARACSQLLAAPCAGCARRVSAIVSPRTIDQNSSGVDTDG